MKKEYEAPKAEKMEFDYEENVVASNGNLKDGGGGTNCFSGKHSLDNTNCSPKYSK